MFKQGLQEKETQRIRLKSKMIMINKTSHPHIHVALLILKILLVTTQNCLEKSEEGKDITHNKPRFRS